MSVVDERVRDLDDAIALGRALVRNLEQVVLGSEGALVAAAIAALSGGHLLIEDVPGVGKTVLARALATSLGADLSRIQGHPDLLPSDITGVSVFLPDTGTWDFRPGPVFAHVVLMDELNRTPPRTQAALLETMEERQVSVDGRSWPLPQPHLVIATQNPLSQRGTFPLVESQLDRFALATPVGYPDAAQEVQLALHGGGTYALAELRAVCTPEEWGAPSGPPRRSPWRTRWRPMRWRSAGPAGRHRACTWARAPRRHLADPLRPGPCRPRRAELRRARRREGGGGRLPGAPHHDGRGRRRRGAVGPGDPCAPRIDACAETVSRRARPARPLAPMAAAVVIIGLWWLVAHNAGSGWVQVLGDLVFGALLIGILGPYLAVRRARITVRSAPGDGVAGAPVALRVDASARVRIRPVEPPGPEVFVGPGGRRGVADDTVTLVPVRRGVHATVDTSTSRPPRRSLCSGGPSGWSWRCRRRSTSRPAAAGRSRPASGPTKEPARWSTGPAPTRACPAAPARTRPATAGVSCIGGRRRTPRR